MPVEHIVCMRLQHSMADDELRAIYRECEAKFDEIPGVLTASMGANWHSDPAGFTHALVIRLRDRAAVEVFMAHPAHAAVGQVLLRHFSDFLVLDYETDRP
jgi:hypothetical protein